MEPWPILSTTWGAAMFEHDYEIEVLNDGSVALAYIGENDYRPGRVYQLSVSDAGGSAGLWLNEDDLIRLKAIIDRQLEEAKND